MDGEYNDESTAENTAENTTENTTENCKTSSSYCNTSTTNLTFNTFVYFCFIQNTDGNKVQKREETPERQKERNKN